MNICFAQVWSPRQKCDCSRWQCWQFTVVSCLVWAFLPKVRTPVWVWVDLCVLTRWYMILWAGPVTFSPCTHINTIFLPQYFIYTFFFFLYSYIFYFTCILCSYWLIILLSVPIDWYVAALASAAAIKFVKRRSVFLSKNEAFTVTVFEKSLTPPRYFMYLEDQDMIFWRQHLNFWTNTNFVGFTGSRKPTVQYAWGPTCMKYL